MKKFSAILVFIFLLSQGIFTSVQGKQIKTTKSEPVKYGVFIGLNSNQIDKLLGYDEVVIDAAYYTKAQIDYLHKNGVKVYSYLNIGSIENFRPYYNKFSDITLGVYENWEDEQWVDVSNAKWKNYIVNTLAKNLYNKGVDGLFLDNIDVYSNYQEDSIFNGLLDILNKLNSKYGKPLIVNGGYDFFTKAMDKKLNIKKLVYGVNTESVYTTVNFAINEFGKNSVTDRGYAVEYLNLLKSKGLKIYIVEYSKDKSITSEINNFHNKLEYNYYISNSLSLN